MESVVCAVKLIHDKYVPSICCCPAMSVTGTIGCQYTATFDKYLVAYPIRDGWVLFKWLPVVTLLDALSCR